MTAFWEVAPSSIVDVDRRSRGSSCLKHQGRPDDGSRLHFWNASLYLGDYKAQYSRKLSSFCNFLGLKCDSVAYM
jgi:hypothetical protein